MKYTQFLATGYSLVLMLLLTVSCSTNPITGETVATDTVDDSDIDVLAERKVVPNDVTGRWRGVLPCAGCPGIVYDLVLLENNTFEESVVYEDRLDGPTNRTGTWRMNDGFLELSGDSAKLTRFSLSTAGELMMLDMAGKPVNEDLSAQYNLRRDTIGAEKETQLWEEKRKIGVDFVATGHEPGWLLEIDQEQGMHFKTRPLEDVVLKTKRPKREAIGNSTTLRGTAEGEELVVELQKQPCTDAMSGKVRPYRVTVTASGKRYSGCGLYLGENLKD